MDDLSRGIKLLFSEQYQKARNLADRLMNEIQKKSDDNIILNSGKKFNTLEFYRTIGNIYGCIPETKDKALDCYKKVNLHIATPDPKIVKNNRTVYSFRPFNEYTLTDLINNTLTVVSPLKMNDPSDTLLFDWESARVNQCIQNFHEQNMSADLSKRCLASESIFQQSLRGYRIRCFSTKANGGRFPYQNTLMWSHYASSHTGICIEYNISPKMQAKKDDYGFQILRNVDYTDKPIDLTNTEIISGYQALFCKHKDWEYEQEVRLLTYSTQIDSDYFPMLLKDGATISAIYFGLQCPEERIVAVRNILRYDNSIQFFKMQKDYSDIYNLNALHI